MTSGAWPAGPYSQRIPDQWIKFIQTDHVQLGGVVSGKILPTGIRSDEKNPAAGTLEQECNRIVREFNLSRKEWCKIKTILNGVFTHSIRKKYLVDNPMDKVEIYVKYRQIVKKTGRTETYNTEKLKELNQYLDKMYTETEDIAFLAVIINFLLGLRVGELAALKWCDLCDNSHLHIVREEIRNQETNRREVVEHTKTNRDRFVILIPKAIAILEKILKEGSYIFMRDGERITSRQIAYVLEKLAERQGVRTKSTHKMRKTYEAI